MDCKVLSFIFFLLQGISLFAQIPPSYVNLTYGDAGRTNSSTSIKKINGSYYIASNNWALNTPNQFDVYKLDTLLNFTKRTNVSLNNKDLNFNTFFGFDYSTIDSSFFIVGVINNDFLANSVPRNKQSMLWKLDNKIDTLWHKTITNPKDSSISLQGISIESNGIILYGQSKEFDVRGDAFYIKVDFNGNELWRKTIKVPNTFGGVTKLIKTKHNRYISIENLLETPSWGYSEIKITSFDTLFNTQWSQIYYTPYFDMLGDLIELSDSNYVYTQGYCDNQPTVWDPLFTRLSMTKVNHVNGNIIWRKKYAKRKDQCQLFSVYESSSKKIYAVGNTNTPYAAKPSGTFISNMLVTNQNGDSLNYQEIFSDSISYNNNLFNLIPTTNGFYCVGRATLPIYTGTVITGANMENWLVKADTNGCFNAFCASSIDTSIHILSNNSELNIYPNPASDNLTIQIPVTLATFDNHYSLSLYDSQGKEIIQTTLNKQEFKLDVSGLGQGMYLAVVRYEGIIRFQRKFMVQSKN